MSITIESFWGALHGSMLMRLLVATVLGGIVGYEREREGKPAGVRTHAMVALGAALFTIVSASGFREGGDPRVAAQIVSGIGFLGAGVILRDHAGVHGLTTAASLWVTAAIGAAVGTDMLLMSSVTALLVFAILRFGPHPRPPQGSG